jgi:hypothetical protein
MGSKRLNNFEKCLTLLVIDLLRSNLSKTVLH